MKTDYCIQANWGARPEGPEQIAERTRRMVAALSEIDPIFSDWQISQRYMPFEPMKLLSNEALARLVAANVTLDDCDQPWPDYGYTVILRLRNAIRSRTLIADVKAGSSESAEIVKNSAEIRTIAIEPSEASFLTVALVKKAILALGAAWDIQWCQAYPWSAIPLWTKPVRARLEVAWVTYLPPRLASLVTPPHTAIVERPPGGGLMMAATNELFSPDNPAHVAVARDIKTALAPVNALPWPLPTG